MGAFEQPTSTGSWLFTFLGNVFARTFWSNCLYKIKETAKPMQQCQGILNEKRPYFRLKWVAEKRFCLSSLVANRPLPSSKNPHFQNEASCTTFLVKMTFICMRMRKWFPYQRLSTYPRFETEARGNLEMANLFPLSYSCNSPRSLCKR